MLYSDDQVKQFEELFKKKMYRVEDIDYQAWLLYKWDSVGSEEEAFNHVLKKRKPANMVPKKTRQKVAPEGAARYHMNAPAWDDVFRERMANEKKNKRGGKKASNVAASTVTSGALEEESVASSAVTTAASLSSPNDDNISISISRGSDNVSGTNVDDDCYQDLPDIREPITNAEIRATPSSDATISKSKKRKGNNSNSRNKRVKVTTTESGVKVPTAPKFPLESGLSPLIDDNDDDNYINNSSNNNDISTQGAKKVIPVISTFLDILDEEMNQIAAVTRPQAPETLVNNNNSSRKLRSRVPSSASSSGESNPQASKSNVHVNPGLEGPASQTKQVVNSTKRNELKVSSKRSSFTSTVTSVSESASTSLGSSDLSVPISMVSDVTDGKQIKDKMTKKASVTRKMKLKPKMNAKK